MSNNPEEEQATAVLDPSRTGSDTSTPTNDSSSNSDDDSQIAWANIILILLFLFLCVMYLVAIGRVVYSTSRILQEKNKKNHRNSITNPTTTTTSSEQPSHNRRTNHRHEEIQLLLISLVCSLIGVTLSIWSNVSCKFVFIETDAYFGFWKVYLEHDNTCLDIRGSGAIDPVEHGDAYFQSARIFSMTATCVGAISVLVLGFGIWMQSRQESSSNNNQEQSSSTTRQLLWVKAAVTFLLFANVTQAMSFLIFGSKSVCRFCQDEYCHEERQQMCQMDHGAYASLQAILYWLTAVVWAVRYLRYNK